MVGLFCTKCCVVYGSTCKRWYRPGPPDSGLYPQHRSFIFGLYGGLAVLVTMGWTFMALVLSHCIILYSVATVKSKLMCFAAGLATLASIKLEPYNSWQVRRLQKDGGKRFKTCLFPASSSRNPW